ncbi:MAG TPA: DUF2877 domain-containing protein [Pedococcus sp.]|nr:DUF2877 domain-containing protein [Pedococcus sp.]
MAAAPTVWPAAVSQRSAGVLGAARRPAAVLGAFPRALYLEVGQSRALLPLVAPGGLRLPTAVTVASTVVGWGVQPGDQVLVGNGEICLPGVVVRAVRSWRPVRAPSAEDGRVPDPGAVRVRLPWSDPARRLTDRLQAGEDVRSGVAALVGAGPGLTPSGDDVLCGMLLGLRLAGPAWASLGTVLWRAVQPRLASTTSLSAALLAEAAEGYAVPPVVRVAEALVGGDTAQIAAAVPAVLAIGHTSGADLLGGLVGALEAFIPHTRRATTLGSLP